MIYGLLRPSPNRATTLSKFVDEIAEVVKLSKESLYAGRTVSIGLSDLYVPSDLSEDEAYDFLQRTGDLLFNSKLDPEGEARELKKAIEGYQLLAMELTPS